MRGSDTSAACPHWKTSRAGITEDIIVGRSQCTRRRAQMLAVMSCLHPAFRQDVNNCYTSVLWCVAKIGQGSLEIASASATSTANPAHWSACSFAAWHWNARSAPEKLNCFHHNFINQSVQGARVLHLRRAAVAIRKIPGVRQSDIQVHTESPWPQRRRVDHDYVVGCPDDREVFFR